MSGPFTISGTISTELNVGIENVQVGITQTPPGVAPLSFERTTDSVGHYIFPAVPNGTDYALMPMKNAEPLNGVTTYDLVLISQHILDINTLNSPYKIIAADANKSNSVTATDILELRKMVLGIYENGLPNAPSWRFVNESFVFPNPNNPFQTPFPETHTEDSLTTNQVNDFVGIKIGDVNNSASSNLNGSAEDRTTGTWWMETTDREVQPGETINVTFRATEAVAGYQFTLDYPGLAVINIKPGSMMQADNFAVFAAESAFTTSFNPTKPADKPEFTVQFRAHETGRLSQILHVSGRITAAQAYSIENIVPPMDVQLRFGSNSAASDAFELLPCTPNPFAEQTKIGFRLPMATTATLRIFDMDGRTVYAHTADYSAGLHSLAMHKSDLKGSG
ncbi:MAG: dockerin type I domain-containing protein, partial [Saprospiraceae bacterium]|nr:dockerin type I domain-containing protein [Saprospiraceae bacterium]